MASILSRPQCVKSIPLLLFSINIKMTHHEYYCRSVLPPAESFCGCFFNKSPITFHSKHTFSMLQAYSFWATLVGILNDLQVTHSVTALWRQMMEICTPCTAGIRRCTAVGKSRFVSAPFINTEMCLWNHYFDSQASIMLKHDMLTGMMFFLQLI